MFWLFQDAFFAICAINLVLVGPFALWCWIQDRRHPPDPQDRERIWYP